MQKYGLGDDFARAYRAHGFVVLTDVFEVEHVRALHDEMCRLFETGFAEVNAEGLQGPELIAHFYTVDKARWRQCATHCWDQLSLLRLAAAPTIADLLPRLGLEVPMLLTRPECRLDMPQDEQYRQPWHQDWRYGQGSVNSVTLWAPLHDVSETNGTIQVIPGSHLKGFLPCEELSGPRRFRLLDPTWDEAPRTPVELSVGEVLVFSQLLIHRSGINLTPLPRLSCQLRFTDAAEPRYRTNGYAVATGSALVWAQPPTRDDMLRVFGAGGGR